MDYVRYILIGILAVSGGAIIYRELANPGYAAQMDKLLFVFVSVLGAVLRDWLATK